MPGNIPVIEREEIARLIPHDGSMVLLDKVLEWSEANIICSTRSHLDENNPLRRGDRLAAVCGVEYAAQAMAVHGGLLDKRRKSGFLASLRNVRLNVDRLDDVNTDLTVAANVRHRESNGYVYAFVVGSNGTELVCGQIAVLVK